MGNLGSIPGLGNSPGGGHSNPFQYSCLENPHEERSLVCYSPWCHELYKRDRHDSDNHDGVITHLEPDILECEVKRVLGSITTNKASGGDEIPVELFQILKDGAVKVLPANLENLAVATGLQKVSFHSNPKEVK